MLHKATGIEIVAQMQFVYHCTKLQLKKDHWETVSLNPQKYEKPLINIL